MNRTSSAASGDAGRTTRNSRGGNREFFQNPPPPDGPRRPGMDSRPVPVADAHALGTDTIARDDAPCPCRWPDTAATPTAGTRAAPPGRKLRYSTGREDEGEKTTSRTPSTDRSALDSGQELVAAAKSSHAGHRPRERQLPTVKSRQRNHPIRSGTPFSVVTSGSLALAPA